MENFVISSTVICRREALLAIGGFKQPPNVPYVDFATWLELSLLGKVRVLNDGIYGYWRRHESQCTKKYMLEMVSTARDIAISFLSRLPEERRKEIGLTTDKVCKRYRNRICDIHYYFGRRALKTATGIRLS